MMEEALDESYDSLDEHDRPAERWAPLGAACPGVSPTPGYSDDK